jgi:hypothetical protein
MKIVNFIVIFSTLSFGLAFSQQQRMHLSFVHHLPIYNKLNGVTKNFENKGGIVHSTAFDGQMNFQFLTTERSHFSAGLSYRYTELFQEDVLSYYLFSYYSNSLNSNQSYIYYFEDVANYRGVSHQFGLNLRYTRKLTWKGKSMGSVDVQADLFLAENFRQQYLSEDFKVFPSELHTQNRIEFSNLTNFRTQYLAGRPSAASILFNYRYPLNLHDGFSVSPKLSVGTNLFSDWEQFKNYAWLGLGLEVGLFQIKNKKQTNEK